MINLKITAELWPLIYVDCVLCTSLAFLQNQNHLCVRFSDNSCLVSMICLVYNLGLGTKISIKLLLVLCVFCFVFFWGGGCYVFGRAFILCPEFVSDKHVPTNVRVWTLLK